MAYPLVPVPGTGDNGYRPNFTTPSPDEVRQARLRGAPLSTEQTRDYESSPEGRSTARQYNQARFERAGGGTRVPPAAPDNSLRTPGPSLPNQAGRAVGQGAKGYVWGERPEATTKLGKLKNGAAGLSTAAGRAVGAVQFGSALRDNFNNVYNVSASDDATLSDRAAAAVEGVGNTVVGGVTGLAKNFPIIGPAVAQFAGTNAVSNALDYISPGTSVINRFNRLRDEAPTPTQKPAAQAPSATAPNSVAQNPVGVSVTGQQGVAPAAPAAPAAPVMTGNVTRNGNEYSGTNIGGDITINGFAPGAGLGRGSTISPQNMAAADGLAAQQERASLGRVMAAQQAQQPLRQFSAPTVNHSGNDWTSREMLRRAKMDASSLIHQSSWAPKGSARAAQEAYKGILEEDLKARNMAPELQAETNRTNASIINTQATADASRYSSDNSLRGTMYSSDNSLRGNIYSADMTAATADRKARADAAKQAADNVVRQNDQDIKNADRTRSWAAQYTPDGKLDEAATNRAISAVESVLPGFSTMSEQARKQNQPVADALLSIYGRTASGRELGLGQTVFGNTNPRGNSLPDFRGGKLKRSGISGALPGGAGVDGYYVTMPDGREVALGQGLTEDELTLIRNNIAGNGWKF